MKTQIKNTTAPESTTGKCACGAGQWLYQCDSCGTFEVRSKLD